MKPETETMLMKQHFHAMKESAAKCLLAMPAAKTTAAQQGQ